MTSKAVSNEASLLWNHPGVATYRDELRHKILLGRQRREAGERDALRRRLWIEATPKGDTVEILIDVSRPTMKAVKGIGETGSQRIAALGRLGQMIGAYTEKAHVEGKKSQAELIAEIREAVAAEESNLDGLELDEEAGAEVASIPETVH